MLVDDIRLDLQDEQAELSGRLTMDRLDTDGLRIWFRFPVAYAGEVLDASPFIPGLLVTAMWWEEDLVIDGPVSELLIGSVGEVIGWYRSLFPALPSIGVDAPLHALSPEATATACLFSRGVDSWYSAVTNVEAPSPCRPPVTHLVHVPSIDFMYSDENRARSIAATRQATETIGCELVVLETNLRHFTERFQHWGVTFGGGLAAVGLTVGAAFSHVLLPASIPHGERNLSGSHEDFDPLWSSERTTIVHDGPISRLEKVRSLVRHPEVLANLKVCFAADTTQNCGRCEKCLITMTELYVAGALDACTAFERRLNPRAVARLPSPGWQRFFFTELIDALGCERRDRALRRALERLVERSNGSSG